MTTYNILDGGGPIPMEYVSLLHIGGCVAMRTKRISYQNSERERNCNLLNLNELCGV